MIVQSRSFPVPSCADPVEFQKRLQQFGIPRPLRNRLVKAVKRMSAPGEFDRRCRFARDIQSRLALPNGIDRSDFAVDGAALIPPSAIPSAHPCATALDRFFEGLRRDGRVATDDEARKGQFLVKIAADNDLLAIPEVKTFALGEEVLSLATGYFGQVPILSGLGLMWSPPNELLEESQLYHFDGEDDKQLKLFLNVKEVTAECGPFTFVPAGLSAKLPRSKRQSARLDDDLVESTVGAGAVTQALGLPGAVAAVDTSRCLHYGSRGNRCERLVLLVQFTRFLAPKARMPRWRLDNETFDDDDLSRLRKMVLNLT